MVPYTVVGWSLHGQAAVRANAEDSCVAEGYLRAFKR